MELRNIYPSTTNILVCLQVSLFIERFKAISNSKRRLRAPFQKSPQIGGPNRLSGCLAMHDEYKRRVHSQNGLHSFFFAVSSLGKDEGAKWKGTPVS